MATPATRKPRPAPHAQEAFQVALIERVEKAGLTPQAQAALLQAVDAAAAATGSAQAVADRDAGELRRWLGPGPANPAQLEFEALQARFAMRRDLLEHTIGSREVVALLGARNRQTPLDRIKAGSLLAFRDQGHWRFPLCQFDPDGPDGVVAGLPEVLAALRLPDLSKARWLQRPQPVFGGDTPLERLRQGQVQAVLEEAQAVGRGQD